MPIDYYEDLMPRNAPKPAPLIEVEATPLVPEVSLLLDQDRNKSLHLNSNPRVNSVAENKSTNSRLESNKEVPYGNQFESYNTWKAKNAELLSAITGSSGGPETVPVPSYSNIRKNNSTVTQRDQSYNKKVQHTEEVNYGGSAHLSRQLQSNKPDLECSRGNESIGQHQSQKVYHQQNNPPGIPVCYSQAVNNYPEYRSKEIIHPHNQCQYTGAFNQTISCFPTTSNSNTMPIPSTDLNTQQFIRQQQNIYLPDQLQMTDTVPKQFNANQAHCQCGHDQCGNLPSTRIQYENNPPCIMKEDRRKEMQTVPGKLISPLDIAHVNNQAIIDLYHIINLQNEQIFMLQQQVKQVLQLHLDCEKSSKQNLTCQHCPCMQRNNCTSKKDTCNDEKNKPEQNPLRDNAEVYEKSKRSIGVMTSSVEKTVQTNPNTTRNTENRVSSKMRQKKTLKNDIIVPPFNTSNRPSRKDCVNAEDKRKKSTPITTNRKANKVESIQFDNSFSLNEAELVIRTDSDQDDISPNNSVHVDLQEYCSSSVESDSESTASSSNEDDRNSESEDDSTNPPLSWTFYNRVVGQVNQILKKNPSPQQQDRPQTHRTPSNQIYGMNADYETENNWSKRVTFDGPPLEDSDNNIPNMREFHKYNQQIQHQEMEMKDGPGRMQDFMMYNFANGNTNLSFASLRYLDRYHNLPSQRHSKPSDQMYNGYQKDYRSTKKSSKKKTRNYEKNSDLRPQINKRKSNTPSSKLLDITALKQQPKLF